MLIECNYCGAPLDVRPNARFAKCKYCDTTSQVESTRTVLAETPPGWRPPREWRPPAHVPADSSQTLLYRAASTVRRIVHLVFTLIFLGAVALFVIWRVSATSPATPTDVRGALESAQRAIGQAEQVAENMRRAASAPAENLFTGHAAADAVSRFAERLGSRPVMALQLVIYPEYAILQARDPRNPKHVDRYTYRAGSVELDGPVNVQSMRGALEDHLVSLDDVRIDKIPELVASTSSSLGYEDAKVTHVIIERNLPFSKQVVMRVYASGPRESGRIDYSATGSVIRLYK